MELTITHLLSELLILNTIKLIPTSSFR
jgi:hypothetical protein